MPIHHTFPNFSFRDGQHGHMSILDVYQAVREIGADHPRSLVKLSVFSHGWMGGPILVNSYNDGRALRFAAPLSESEPFRLPAASRGSDDMNQRVKHFTQPTMDSVALENFIMPFTPTVTLEFGDVHLLGCPIKYCTRSTNILYTEQEGFTTIHFLFNTFTAEEADLLEDYIQHVVGGLYPR